MAEIAFAGVKKKYGDTQVIHGIDMQIADGELIVIVGPSGCGKSTLLRMVAGLEQITEGEISIGPRVVNRLEPKDRDIAMVFQNYALYPHMSVYDNMAYGLKIAGMPKAAIDERVQTAAGMLELSELLKRKPRQLSGGQRQRVAMGRAIVRQPSTFLFDEPLSNLDAKLRVQMRLEIKQLQRRLGTTSLYVTHDQVEAMTLADRLIVMNAGVAEQIDTPMAVYERPASRFVAGFIGSPAMNFLNARVSDDGSRLLVDDAIDMRGAGLALGNLAGRELTLGVRPEHLRLVEQAEADLHLQVGLVETLGADLLAHGHLGGRKAASGDLHADMSSVVTVRLPGVARVAEGDRLPLRAADGALHLFDGESGKRLADV
jgi:sn-glycerol 3-phosphate transport system ATP-binding protein